MVAASGAQGLTAASTRQAGLLSIGSGVSSLAAGFASLQASRVDARQLKTQQIFQGLAISAEKLRAREEANFLRQKFLKDISSANASFAARGIDISSGVGRELTIQSLEGLGQDIKATELRSEGAQLQLRLDASQTRLSEKSTRNLGISSFARTFQSGGTGLLTGFQQLEESRKLAKLEAKSAGGKK